LGAVHLFRGQCINNWPVGQCFYRQSSFFSFPHSPTFFRSCGVTSVPRPFLGCTSRPRGFLHASCSSFLFCLCVSVARMSPGEYTPFFYQTCPFCPHPRCIHLWMSFPHLYRLVRRRVRFAPWSYQGETAFLLLCLKNALSAQEVLNCRKVPSPLFSLRPPPSSFPLILTTLMCLKARKVGYSSFFLWE